MTRRSLIKVTPGLIATPAVFLAGCSPNTPAKKQEQKPAEPITGLSALFRCYQGARTWAQDLQILRMTSIRIAEVKPEPGKAAAWQAIFVSASSGKQRAYTYSVYDASVTLRKGIFPEREAPWSGSGKPFIIAAAKVDTDAVWETASKKGEAYSKKNPDMPITYTLENFSQTNNAAWRVIWGESASASSFSVLVDASTGAFLEVLH